MLIGLSIRKWFSIRPGEGNVLFNTYSKKLALKTNIFSGKSVWCVEPIIRVFAFLSRKKYLIGLGICSSRVRFCGEKYG